MIAADTVGLDHYLYTGPKDGITRAFCRPLINKVVDKTQLGKLNNGQGLTVRTSGGGYNCRHSWTKRQPRTSPKLTQEESDEKSSIK